MKYSINLDNQSETDFHELFESAKRILEVSESDYKKLKEESWFKKFLKTVPLFTNNKRTEIKAIGSLADVQKIALELMVHLSKRINDVAEYCKTNAEQIGKLAKQINGVVKYLTIIQKNHELFFGIEKDITLESMSEEAKGLLLKLMRQSTDIASDPNQNSYRMGVFKSFGIKEFPKHAEEEIKPELTKKIKNIDEWELMAKTVYVYLALGGERDASPIVEDVLKRYADVKDEIERNLIAYGVEYYSEQWDEVDDTFDVVIEEEKPLDEFLQHEKDAFFKQLYLETAELRTALQEVMNRAEIQGYANHSIQEECVAIIKKLDKIPMGMNGIAFSKKVDYEIPVISVHFLKILHPDSEGVNMGFSQEEKNTEIGVEIWAGKSNTEAALYAMEVIVPGPIGWTAKIARKIIF